MSFNENVQINAGRARGGGGGLGGRGAAIGGGGGLLALLIAVFFPQYADDLGIGATAPSLNGMRTDRLTVLLISLP